MAEIIALPDSDFTLSIQLAMSIVAKRHMQRVSELPCLICEQMGLGASPAHVHHVFDSAARSDFLTVPLCPAHHTGPDGFHGLGEREFNRRYKTTEADLLAITLEKLARAA